MTKTSGDSPDTSAAVPPRAGKHRPLTEGKRRRPLARIWHWLSETLLTLLAVFGVICLGATAAAWFFGVNIMMFKTGSMSPGIPAGSVALVREIPAAEAAVGDVITVDRPGQLPITHRVISNEPDPENAPLGRIIEMKGDDNPNPDPFPFRVEEVKLLFWSQPELGHIFARLADPKMLGLVTMLAAIIVTWAFWPRGEASENGAPETKGRK